MFPKEDVNSGSRFYWPPGHTAEADMDAGFVLLNPPRGKPWGGFTVGIKIDRSGKAGCMEQGTTALAIDLYHKPGPINRKVIY